MSNAGWDLAGGTPGAPVWLVTWWETIEAV